MSKCFSGLPGVGRLVSFTSMFIRELSKDGRSDETVIVQDY